MVDLLSVMPEMYQPLMVKENPKWIDSLLKLKNAPKGLTNFYDSTVIEISEYKKDTVDFSRNEKMKILKRTVDSTFVLHLYKTSMRQNKEYKNVNCVLKMYLYANNTWSDISSQKITPYLSAVNMQNALVNISMVDSSVLFFDEANKLSVLLEWKGNGFAFFDSISYRFGKPKKITIIDNGEEIDTDTLFTSTSSEFENFRTQFINALKTNQQDTICSYFQFPLKVVDYFNGVYNSEENIDIQEFIKKYMNSSTLKSDSVALADFSPVDYKYFDYNVFPYSQKRVIYEFRVKDVEYNNLLVSKFKNGIKACGLIFYSYGD